MVDLINSQPSNNNLKALFEVHHVNENSNEQSPKSTNNLNISYGQKKKKIRLKDRILWTKKEDNLLRKIMSEVENTGIFNNKQKGRWLLVKSKLDDLYNLESITSKKKTSKQIRERWLNILSWSDINLSPWTDEEDMLLFALQEKYGTKWKLIKQSFPYRNEYHIKNRYYMLLKRKRKPNPIKLGYIKDPKDKSTDNYINNESTNLKDTQKNDSNYESLNSLNPKDSMNLFIFENLMQIEWNNMMINNLLFHNAINQSNLFQLLMSNLNTETQNIENKGNLEKLGIQDK